jgi:isopentenyldiphosphate isomerase
MSNMPDEIITLYTKEAPDAPFACGRTEYYDNDFTTHTDHYPAIIDVLLFNTHGDLLLQKRGRNKRNNPGKLHTTVGGHINWGERPEFSLVHECMEELGAPVLLFPKEDYAQALAKLGPYTHKAALLYEVADVFRNHSADPIENRRHIKDRIWLYFGRYDGPVEIQDRESAGYEWMSLEEFEREFKTDPSQFTSGLKLFIETFQTEIREFIKTYCNNARTS